MTRAGRSCALGGGREHAWPFAQLGSLGFGGQIELEALRLHGLPEDAPTAPSPLGVDGQA